MEQKSVQMSEQARLWNGTAGQAWVDVQEVLDGMFKPFEDMLVDAVIPGSRVLDIGCGTGAISLACARKGAAVVGVDISAPMLALARSRAGREGLPLSFLCTDAQHHDFLPGSVDRIVSRFGVMFFDDPVRAFSNLRRAGSAKATLQCFVWRSAAENPFMTTAECAARPLLPDLPVRNPDAPGQFAFADERRVEGILQASGWTDIKLRPVDSECVFPEAALETYFMRLGTLGLILQTLDECARIQVLSAVRAAFEPYVFAGNVRFTAACWSVEAVV